MLYYNYIIVVAVAVRLKLYSFKTTSWAMPVKGLMYDKTVAGHQLGSYVESQAKVARHNNSMALPDAVPLCVLIQDGAISYTSTSKKACPFSSPIEKHAKRLSLIPGWL